MKKHLLLLCIIFITHTLLAQNTTLSNYRASKDKINNLIHTRLDVSLNYQKRQLNGKAWITLKPHFYPTDSLRLDAKGMDIHQVALIEGEKTNNLKYTYDDSLSLSIKLNKTYTSAEKYTIYIAYTAKPDELKTKGSAAITSDKGLYFINPDSTIAHKPVQVWTQGETEASSVWFPTIDSPNQKTTQEISITVPNKYASLSNGLLVKQAKNADGTRTDYWKMDQPHAPYLFMMAVGNFRITQDKWKEIPLDYYLEPTYAPYAKAIFGDTPEMMDFFSKKLELDYPWKKYAQVVVRDFVSGAMENTTATIHGDFVQQTDREILDEHAGEDVIAHELFHHWFGNYVTAESWSNLSINESFANLSETLWKEYKHGKDEGDAKNYEDMSSYLSDPAAKDKELIRFHYHDKEDMFDVVSYQKGGRILNMLRHHIGEEAFYKSMSLFLKQNAYKTGEAHQFRLAVEEVTGKDFNWFFNQWYFRNGHPVLDISYQWDEKAKQQKIILKQEQNEDIFLLPMKIDIYLGNKKETIAYQMNKRTDTISVELAKKPDLVNVDADKILLAQKTDHKTLAEYVFQYKNAPLFLDRLEALEVASKSPTNAYASQIITSALEDKFHKIRIKAIDALAAQKASNKKQMLPTLKNIIRNDEKTLVKAAAIDALAATTDKAHLPVYIDALNSKSYAVQASALVAIRQHDAQLALTKAQQLEADARGALAVAIVNLYAEKPRPQDFAFVSKAFDESSIQNKLLMVQNYILILSTVDQIETVKEKIDQLFKIGVQYKSYGIDKYVVGLFDAYVGLKQKQLSKANVAQKYAIQQQIAYAESRTKELLGN